MPQTTPSPTSRDAQGRFLKGRSGNPGGQPKGLSLYIRAKTAHGQALVRFMLRVFRGELVKGRGKDGTLVDLVPTLADRIEAATWLADRGFGRPVQALEIESEPRPPFIIALRQPIRIEGRREDRDGAPPQRPGLPAKGAEEAAELLTFDQQPEEPPRRRRS